MLNEDKTWKEEVVVVWTIMKRARNLCQYLQSISHYKHLASFNGMITKMDTFEIASKDFIITRLSYSNYKIEIALFGNISFTYFFIVKYFLKINKLFKIIIFLGLT